MSRTFYVTTPIYYVTDKPHIGHLYTTLAADTAARYHRLMGHDVRFLTGTDEHGQKIEKKAREMGETPLQLADRVVERYRDAWKRYGIEYDDFIRTTEDRHKKVVQHYFAKLIESGDMYLGTYEGWYCVPDEAYWAESQLNDGCCPDCGRPVEKLQEESYFFKLSAYVDKLVQHIENHPDFIQPESRKNEVLGFLKQEVRDISASRTTIHWGVAVPPAPASKPQPQKAHTVYVWFDALTNYLSALEPLEGGSLAAKYWPAAVHIVGKDILRFHAVYWPAFLMALGLEPPKQIIAHGWLTDTNKKIGKSLGNAIDPMALADEVGVDGMRYFLLREFVFGQDGEYTRTQMIHRINADLANDFGNCLSRVCNMVVKNFGSEGVDLASALKEESPLKQVVAAQLPAYHAAMDKFQFDKALAAVWRITSEANRFIESSAPWALAKSQEAADQKRLRVVLLHCVEALRLVALAATPFIPHSTTKALETLGASACLKTSAPLAQAEWGKGPEYLTVSKPTPLFPRLDLAEEATP